MKKIKNDNEDPLLKELGSIKRLLILFLIKAGTSQAEIATALCVDQTTVSLMFPARKVKRFKNSKFIT